MVSAESTVVSEPLRTHIAIGKDVADLPHAQHRLSEESHRCQRARSFRRAALLRKRTASHQLLLAERTRHPRRGGSQTNPFASPSDQSHALASAHIVRAVLHRRGQPLAQNIGGKPCPPLRESLHTGPDQHWPRAPTRRRRGHHDETRDPAARRPPGWTTWPLVATGGCVWHRSGSMAQRCRGVRKCIHDAGPCRAGIHDSEPSPGREWRDRRSASNIPTPEPIANHP